MLGDVVALREMRRVRMSTEDICRRFRMHKRDSVIELIDACRRHTDNLDALAHANRVTDNIRKRVPMVNGTPESERSKPTPYYRRFPHR